MNFSVTGNLVDVVARKIYPARVEVSDGRISAIIPVNDPAADQYLIPGFIDAHVHVESSMLIPSEFARLAVLHGTVASVSDPHEIANVCGIAGVEYMIRNGKTVPFKFSFGVPSCVPATVFETAGASLGSEEVARLLEREETGYLAEMMNFPGVIGGDEEVMKKINAAHRAGKPVDGHAPGLSGDALARYAAAGISTDHECSSAEEALAKLHLGMKILVREGSAAKNFDALIGLLDDYPDSLMFCSDDKHPDSLMNGHINQLCARAVAAGADVFNVLKAACVNPVRHYRLKAGLLSAGDPADFVAVKDLKDFEVIRTYIDGMQVAERGKTLIPHHRQPPEEIVNNFCCRPQKPSDFAVKTGMRELIPVIEAFDGELLTKKLLLEPKTANGELLSDPDRDILKIVVVNRYRDAPPAKAFIKNFGLKKGAIASSVAHDSHNIVAVGVDDPSICRAVNLLIEKKGGISCTGGDADMLLPLPVAGLMSAGDGYQVASAYTEIDRAAKALGCSLSAPFMTLSFMSLLVIPELKLSDEGLFDGVKFGFTED